MTDYRSVLERDLRRVGPAAFTLDDVARRRDRRQRNRRITAGIVALALVALVFGGLLRALTSDRSAPLPAEKPTRIGSVRALPDRPGEWTFETSLGTWTWTRVDGDRETLPRFVSYFADGRYWAFDDGLWSSVDGVTWTREPMPDVFGGREPWARADDGGSVWATTEDGSLYLHEGGSSWRPVTVPAASVPSIPGMVWGAQEPTVVVSWGGRTLALRHIGGIVDWSAGASRVSGSTRANSYSEAATGSRDSRYRSCRATPGRWSSATWTPAISCCASKRPTPGSRSKT